MVAELERPEPYSKPTFHAEGFSEDQNVQFLE